MRTRRSFRFLLAALLGSSLGAPTSATSAPSLGAGTSRVVDAASPWTGTLRPWLATGPLSAAPPSGSLVDDALAVAQARGALSRHLPWTVGLRLELERVDLRDDGSRVVRFRQTVDGLPVSERGARALVEGDGSVTIVTAWLDERARVGGGIAHGAAAAAAVASRRAPLGFSAGRARLVLIAEADGLHPNWVLDAEVSPELPMRPRAVVDATSGALRTLTDRARSAKKLHAFATNPFVTKTLDTFTLGALPDGASVLETPTVTALSCVDKKSVKTVKGFGDPRPMHVCDLVHAAAPDGSGDFLYPRPSTDTAVDDPLAETSMAYHTDRGLSFFAGLGLPSLRKLAVPLTTVANVRFPPGFSSPSPAKLACDTCALEPVDNAFFSPGDEPDGDFWATGRDMLYFGQGTKYDYGYDGDVVYHELGHGVVESTAKLTNLVHLDAQGAVLSPSALNEGLADYFSSALAGDSRVGEYASGGKGIRDLNNGDRCPDILVNEPHVDSTAFSGALWSVRSALATDAERKAFDRGVLLALQVLPSGDVGFEDLTVAVVTSVAKEAGDAPAVALKKEASKRGLDACTRERDAVFGAKSPWYGFLAYGNLSVDGKLADAVVPGSLQFFRTLPAGTASITVSLDGQDMPSGAPWMTSPTWSPTLLVKFDAPIRWSLVGGAWKGDYVEKHDLVPGDAPWSESIPVPAGATRAYVVIGTLGEGNGLYDNVAIEPVVRPVVEPPPEAGPPPDTGRPDAGPEADAHPGDAPGDEDLDLPIVNGRACTCRAPGGSSAAMGTPSAALLLALIAGFSRRRRAGRREGVVDRGTSLG